MNYWVMSDWHFEHKRMVELCGRPVDYEQRIIKSLKIIPLEDTLIYLGDISIGKDIRVYYNIISNLTFNKVLVKGNHDNKSYSWYMDHGWDFVCESLTMNYGGKNILFSHKPMDGDYDLNIHGHLHNVEHHNPTLYDNQILIKCEHEYKPIQLRRLIK